MSYILAIRRERWRENAVNSVILLLYSPRGEKSGEKYLSAFRSGLRQAEQKLGSQKRLLFENEGCDMGIFRLRIEAGTGFLHPGEVAVTKDLSIRVVVLQRAK